MEHIIINVPSGKEYLSEVEEIKTIYNNDLPHNAVINKGITGCGGTSLALLNEEKYVIACHLKSMMLNKAEQKDIYPDLLLVTGDTSVPDILTYVENGGKKILVTYDSVPRIINSGIDTSEWRLLVDEFHKIPTYLNAFKPQVIMALLERTYKFKSVSYISATPTDVKWLPAPLKELPLIEFKWEGASKPDLEHSYIPKNMIETVLSTTLHYLDNTQDEVYIFYNSRYSVASLIKKLLTCKKDLTLSDINIMFSETTENTTFFRKHLGNTFKYGQAPNGENNKRINIISSMGFEGLDYYPNHVTDAKPVTLVVSDPNSKTMQFDINVELTQILGRFRKHKVKNCFVHNKIIYLWNTINSDVVKTEEQYLAEVIEEKQQSEEVVLSCSNPKQKRVWSKVAKEGTDAFIVLSNPEAKNPQDYEVILNPYAVEAKMTLYNAVHSDAITLNNIDENGKILNDSRIVTKLSDLSKDNITYSVPALRSEYTKALGRSPSVKKLIKEYQTIYEHIWEANEQKDKELIEKSYAILDSFFILNPEFKSWIDVGLTPQNMASCSYMKGNIETLAESYRVLNSVKEEMNDFLEVGRKYVAAELKEIVGPILEKSNINVTGQSVNKFIEELYKVKNTSIKVEGKVIRVKEIVSKI